MRTRVQGGGYYGVAFDTGSIVPENQLPYQTLGACLIWMRGETGRLVYLPRTAPPPCGKDTSSAPIKVTHSGIPRAKSGGKGL